MTTNANNDVRSINNKMFRKIDNLEYIPLEILYKKFTYVDDVGLLSLAVNSNRFDGIAKMVFNERYAQRYFVIDGSKKDAKEFYSEILGHFNDGANVKSLKIIGIQNINANHWMPQVLLKSRIYANQIETLKFDRCTFQYEYSYFLWLYTNIKHLSLRNCRYSKRFKLPTQSRKLTKLTIHNSTSVSFSKLIVLLLRNPGLKLSLKDNVDEEIAKPTCKSNAQNRMLEKKTNYFGAILKFLRFKKPKKKPDSEK